MSSSSTETPTIYSASCHCNLISFTVTLPDALAPQGKGTIGHCNCSICTKYGYLLVYPLRSDVKFAGDCEKKLKSYFFGRKEKPHKFCPECSSNVLIDFENSPMEEQRPHLAINARLFKDIDLEKAEYDRFDGRNELPHSNEQERM